MVLMTTITQPSIPLSHTSIEHRTQTVRQLSDYNDIALIACTSRKQVDGNGHVQ
jgi:hypothetical protein